MDEKKIDSIEKKLVLQNKSMKIILFIDNDEHFHLTIAHLCTLDDCLVVMTTERGICLK